MKYFVDCEFDGHNGPLLSMALVREDGRSIHIKTDQTADDPWVRANVVPLLDSHRAQASQWVPLNEVGPSVRSFLGDDRHPVIVADSPVDIGRFCNALSTGADGGWSSANFPQISCEVHNVDCWPNDLEGGVQHNAWWDAMALREMLSAQPFGRGGNRREFTT